MSSRILLWLGAAGVLAGCAGDAAAGRAAVSLPVDASQRALASTTLYTSPDGGIYKNPDALELRMVRRMPPDEVLALLPGSAQSWQPLRGLGDFTFIGLTVRNDGKAGSDPRFNAAQVASDFAPDGTATGPLRQYYHPMFPLALLSVGSSDGSCTLHVDPGQTVVAVLVYPPLRPATSIVWGEYHDFALTASLGGGLPPGTYSWRATACVPPPAPPS